MKKLSAIFLAVAVLAVFTTPSFAMLRKDLQSVKGIVTSINTARTEITVKDSVSGKEVTFNSPGVSVDVMKGQVVVVLYKVGTNDAKTVRVVPLKKAAVAAAASTYSAPKAVSSDTYTTPKTTAPVKKSSW